MTTISLVQNFVDPFIYGDYTYSFNYSSNVQIEDEIQDIETVDLTSDTITINFRSSDWYDYVSSSYISENWYQITPIDDSLYDALFSSSSIAKADLYYFTAPIGLTFIAYNQLAEDTLVYDGSWSSGYISLYSIKLLVSTVTK